MCIRDRPSSDPMLAELTPYLKDIKWNDEQAEKKILPILAKSEIFGVNLEMCIRDR